MSELKIYQAMVNIMKDIEPIAKSRQNTQQNFKYRGIDDIYSAINVIMAKYGVFMTTTVMEDKGEERKSAKGNVLIYRILKCQFTFWAVDGSSVSSVTLGEAMDSGDKASNKAMAVAHKYALLQAWCIPTEEAKDTDADSHDVEPKTDKPKSNSGVTKDDFLQGIPNPPPPPEPVKDKNGWTQVNGCINQKQAKRLFAICKEQSVTHDTLKRQMVDLGIEHTNEIPYEKYDEIVAWVKNGGQEPPDIQTDSKDQPF